MRTDQGIAIFGLHDTADPAPKGMPNSSNELRLLLDASDDAARERAWSEFLRAFSPLLLHVARSASADRDDAMDAYTFVLGELRANAFQRLRSYADDGRSKFSTWLVVVARRLCLDHHRRQGGRMRDVQTEAARIEQGFRRRLNALAGEDVEVLTLSSETPDADEQLRATELRQALTTAIEALPPADQLLLSLRYDDELSAQQIARIIQVPTPFHVYRRLEALTTTLRKWLHARGFEGATP